MFSVRLRNFWDQVRATYWFVPALMTLAAAVLAFVMFKVDQTIPNSLLQGKWYLFHPLSTEDARAILNTVADTSLGVAGVVFSITLVPLTITSTQYGSIVLRGFLRDRGTQFVLGAYTATTFYCLFLILGLAGAGNQTIEVSVTLAFYLLSISLLLLIYFFHHVADSMQASTIIEKLSEELRHSIEECYPLQKPASSLDDQYTEELIRQATQSDGEVTTSDREGYVRAIDYGYLIQTASEHNLILRMERLPGDFVSRGDPLLTAWPNTQGNKMRPFTNRAYMLGKNRTLFQDTEYAFYLIVTIAVRALSPAINDSYTPFLCLDRLGAALETLAERQDPAQYYFDKNNHLRLINRAVSFERLVGVAFNLIREYGRENAEILIKMLNTIKSVAAHTHSDSQREILLKHATLIDSDIALASGYDRQRVHDAYDETVRAIGLGYEPTNPALR